VKVTTIKIDGTPPTLGILLRMPEDDVEPYQELKVSANITDLVSGVMNVTLSYNLNNSAMWIDVPMTLNSTSSLYEATISGQQANTSVKYRIGAYDNAGNYKVEDNSGQYYIYTVIPEFSSTTILILFMVLTTLAAVFLKKFKLSKKHIACEEYKLASVQK